jgi:2,4-dienoyl-CoA reductase-like NADH-dependent reductase (Old Yellow Enzyme family)/thioredoxin reductase
VNETTFARLFSPVRINGLEIKNRFFMPPMCTGFATVGGEITDRLVAYYAERAKGGVGLINVEFASITPAGKVFDHMIGIYDDRLIPSHKRLVDAVHKAGSKIAVQISHAGRRAHSTVTGEIPIAPSPIPRLNGEVPRALSIDEIKSLISAFGMAGIRAEKAGYDAVMIHMAHGYLIHQFLSPLSNTRQDPYGKDIQGRSRFAIEVLCEIRKQLGKDFPITCRLCGDEYLEGGFDLSQSRYTAKMLEENGIDAIDVSAGTHETDYIISAPSQMPPGFLTHLSKGIKEVVRIPVGIVGRINDPALAERILEKKEADFVSMGRPLIADPELPVKAYEGRLNEIRPCTACNMGCNDRMYYQLDISCQVNPMAGRELDFAITPSSRKKRVMIIGGGPAGLEAARVSALRGHEVFLYEKDERVGGQLNLASIPPGKADYRRLIQYYESRMEKLKVNVLFKEAGRKEIAETRPDILIFCTGGRPKTVPQILINNCSVLNAWEVLKGAGVNGDRVIIVGGGQVGCETAEFLLKQNKRVTILEMTGQLASDMSKRARRVMMDHLMEGVVDIIQNAVVQEISQTEIRFERAGLSQKIRDFDQVLFALGTVPEQSLLKEVGDIGIPSYAIGDCVSPRRVLEAIREGFDTAIKL